MVEMVGSARDPSGRETLLLVQRLPDYNRDGSLAEQAALVASALGGRGSSIASLFWRHYERAAAVADLWTKEQVGRLEARTAIYFESKFVQPLGQEWVDLAQELAASAYKAAIPITTVLASLSEAHRGSLKEVAKFPWSNDGERLASLEGLSRINLLEAEIITTALAELRAGDVESERKRSAAAFRHEITRALSSAAAQTNGLASQADVAARSASAVETRMADVTTVSAAAAGSMAEAATASASISSSMKTLQGDTEHLSREVAHALRASADVEEQCEHLGHVASQMVGIVEIVRSIANTTKLLALNASIEAARSGEAGRGFSVVASEIKSLSEQTTGAIEDIATRIQTMQAVTSKTTAAHDVIKGVIESVERSAAEVGDIINSQSESFAAITAATEQSAHAARRSSDALDQAQEEGHAMSMAFVELHGKIVEVNSILEGLEAGAERYISTFSR